MVLEDKEMTRKGWEMVEDCCKMAGNGWNMVAKCHKMGRPNGCKTLYNGENATGQGLDIAWCSEMGWNG